MRICKHCGAEFTTQPGKDGGRPAAYCSTGCRRAAEYEIRRLDRHLFMARERLLYSQREGFGRGKVRETMAAQIVELEQRLRALLN